MGGSRRTIDNSRGRIAGLNEALSFVYDHANHHLCPAESAGVVQSIRRKLADAIFKARESHLKDIRLAKAKGAT